MKWKAKILEVGKQAIDPRENIIIMFGDNATDELKNVSVIQKFDTDHSLDNFVFEKGDQIKINSRFYEAIGVGSLVTTDMKDMGHATLVFIDQTPQKLMKNAIYLQKMDEEKIPNFVSGDEIEYIHGSEMN
ncbi:PTS glucitol/sorbitol transporter subunit IIA [uncultured Lactobacillus sp.]|uniref:PTS glucitol/sorbitol transporter subunit IIA n=1 Tax=uncultured Lactobacillus sp. TaxID=153152 RepID=UPI0026212DB5|nr:PTS glucitol/sorbitol transporter subunit IIA [uncultured Lactobacillus sp.]